jgi:hypothetical protein
MIWSYRFSPSMFYNQFQAVKGWWDGASENSVKNDQERETSLPARKTQ